MNLKIMQWNALSLKKHCNELRRFLATSKTTPDVICVAETFLKSSHTFSLEGYDVIRRDRADNQKGGGVATLIRSGVKFQNLDLNFTKIEALAVQIFCKKTKVTIVNVYDPPGNLVALEDYRQVFNIGGRVIVTGDFNAHNPLWKSEQMDRRGRCVEGMLDDYDFIMLNTGQSTFQRAHGDTSVLDLSFASRSIANRCEWSVSNSTLGSDHVPTFIE